jgi:hypothetical protein
MPEPEESRVIEIDWEAGVLEYVEEAMPELLPRMKEILETEDDVGAMAGLRSILSVGFCAGYSMAVNHPETLKEGTDELPTESVPEVR